MPSVPRLATSTDRGGRPLDLEVLDDAIAATAASLPPPNPTQEWYMWVRRCPGFAAIGPGPIRRDDLYEADDAD